MLTNRLEILEETLSKLKESENDNDFEKDEVDDDEDYEDDDKEDDDNENEEDENETINQVEHFDMVNCRNLGLLRYIGGCSVTRLGFSPLCSVICHLNFFILTFQAKHHLVQAPMEFFRFFYYKF